MPQPKGKTATSPKEALENAREIGYPVVVRPSYVLGGRAMEIVNSDAELEDYMEQAVKASPEHPVLVDRYLTGKEIEVDAISDGETVIIPVLWSTLNVQVFIAVIQLQCIHHKH